ncbi:MAG: phosphate acyltransferase [Desulfatiglandales bacterium]
MYKTNFDFIVEKAEAVEKPIRVAIAGANAENILLAAFEAADKGFVKPILVGDADKITKMLKDLNLYNKDYSLKPVPEETNVVQYAIKLIKAGEADALVRGFTQTRDFVMPILDKRNGLLVKDQLLTHVTMLKLPDYGRILAISDVTMLVNPDMNQRKKVIRNMVGTLKALGYDHPNVALLSLVEEPAFHMKNTIEAETIVREHKEKPIADCELVGPIAYDLIVSKEAARLKNFNCPLCGEFDGIVVPNLLTGNVLVKALQIHGHASSCGVIAGAKIPVVISSRSDTKEQAFLCLAACAALNEQKQK